LPVSDQPVRTRVLARERWWPFQEFMIAAGAEGPIDDVEFRGAGAARPTPEVLTALAQARAIVIGPSNPVISIGPMLALAEFRRAIQDAAAPVIAVSPFVRGRILKGPTKPFLVWAGQPLTSTGIATLYSGLIDGLVADERTDLVPVLEIDVLMDSAAARARVAEEALRFALAIAEPTHRSD
jgi:LPPG:FO 2-phospho-L-lactate transferase